MSDTKALTTGRDKIALEFGHGSEPDTVHESIQFAVTLLELLEHTINLLVPGNITHERFGSGQRQDQVLRFHFHPLVLIGDSELRAGSVLSLGDSPRNAALVGETKHHGNP